MGMGDNRGLCFLAFRTFTLVGGDYMIKKAISTYILIGGLTTSLVLSAYGLKGEIYTRKILNRIKQKPYELIEPILLWPTLWYEVAIGLHNHYKKEEN